VVCFAAGDEGAAAEGCKRPAEGAAAEAH
jgi:hypothetical protein